MTIIATVTWRMGTGSRRKLLCLSLMPKRIYKGGRYRADNVLKHTVGCYVCGGVWACIRWWLLPNWQRNATFQGLTTSWHSSSSVIGRPRTLHRSLYVILFATASRAEKGIRQGKSTEKHMSFRVYMMFYIFLPNFIMKSSTLDDY
jgi:hypothetical protein